MEIIAKYVHGSEDSLDLDTFYQVDKLPSFQECKAWCDSIKDENANLIVISPIKHVVTDVYKGTVDEVNNSLIRTYNLHHQTSPEPFLLTMKRDCFLKYIRAVRSILSHLSRSEYREKIKEALQKSWTYRVNVLSNHCNEIFDTDFEKLNKNMSGEDIKKVIAFQIGQCLGLMDGKEYYTKSEITKAYPILGQFLYREKDSNIKELSGMVQYFIRRLVNEVNCKIISQEENPNTVTFIDGKYDIKFEKRIW